jgi:hypothetical protein
MNVHINRDYEKHVHESNLELTNRHGSVWGPKAGECCMCRKPLTEYGSKFLCITHPLMRCPDHGDWPMVGWIYYTDG